jgi:hypothetical protein
VKDREIDDLLDQSARAARGVSPALLRQITASIQPSLLPVRPIPPAWVLTTGVILVSASTAIAGAARAGFFGFALLTALQRALIFSSLVLLAWLAASAFVASMIPGSPRRVPAGWLPAVGSLVLIAVFAVLFRDYRTGHFVTAGIACLLAGLAHAIPAGLLCWLLLRRGFAVHPISAGAACGALAGFAGIAMLELHCSNLEAPHLMLWHTAVVPVSAALGALLGWAFRAYPPFRQP